MPESLSAAFSEPEDFAAAMRPEGYLNFFVATPKQFRARLTQVSLNEIRLTAVEERTSRVAFVSVPVDAFLITFSIGSTKAPVFSGMRIRELEFVTVGPGEQFHARTDGPSHWGTIRLSTGGLSDYGAALVDGAFHIPRGARRWRPPAKMARDLRSLHAAAMRMAAQHPQALVDAEAAHGLEQQLVHAVLGCFSGLLPEEETHTQKQNRRTMLHFEQVLGRAKSRRPSLSEICAELRVSERYLRRLCAEHLGMSPAAYDRLRRMWLARRGLRGPAAPPTSVSKVARDNGFNDLGRFAVNYRRTFGELPSATLHRSRIRSTLHISAQVSAVS